MGVKWENAQVRKKVNADQYAYTKLAGVFARYEEGRGPSTQARSLAG